MSSDVAIAVSGLGKCYHMYTKPLDRLKQMVVSRLALTADLKRRRYFREFWALEDIAFAIRRGESVAIIGQNGSGKSTLLQLVCKTLFPTHGEVSVHGRIAALLELGAGFNPEFTGSENIYLSGLLYGISSSDLAGKYQSIVDFSEIGAFIDQPVKTYSSGMYVRLAFAIAAHVDADILVIDEALSVGDVRFAQKCMRFLRDFQKNGTLLFVSHDTAAVTNLCGRAIWLDQGRLMMDGTAKSVVEAYLARQHARDKGFGEAFSDEAPSEGGARIAVQSAPEDVLDVRLPLLKEVGLSTTIEVFSFEAEEGDGLAYGARGATIDGVALLGLDGMPLHLSHGGELVTLRISALMHQDLENLIFGFYFKDRLGQRLFGDNTFLTTLRQPVHCRAESRYRADFTFRMPVLPVGAYSVDVAIATGDQDNHVQQHWVHDSITLRASDTSMRHGLVGIPMVAITLEEEH